MKKKQHLTTLILRFILLFTPLFSFSQYSIKGIIYDETNNETLPGVVIRIENTNLATVTSIDGSFQINIPKDTLCILNISCISYQPITLEGVRPSNTILAKLKPELKELNTVEVVGNKVHHTENAVIADIRNMSLVASGTSKEQISRAQDKNAAEAARRIPGVTIQDNRFVVIRGMNDRYNTVYLDELPAPSLETDKKSFSFDLFPASAIDKIVIYKTFSPELKGDFGGGAVKIFTSEKTDGQNISVSLGSAYKSNYTNNATTLIREGSFLPSFNSEKNIPDNMPRLSSNLSQEERKKYGSQLNDNWELKKKNPLPDQKFGVTYMKQVKKISISSALNYSNAEGATVRERKFFDFQGNYSSRASDYESSSHKKLGGLLNASMLVNPRLKLQSRNYLIFTEKNFLTQRSTFDFGDNEIENNYWTGLQQRLIMASQFCGGYDLKNERTQINWSFGGTQSVKNDPDLRKASYKVDVNSEDNKSYTLLIPAPGQVDINRAGRLYQELDETTLTGQASLSHAFNLLKKSWSIQIGGYWEDKDRTFQARAFGYSPASLQALSSDLTKMSFEEAFKHKNLHSPNGLQIQEDNNSTYKYVASNQLQSIFWKTEASVTPKIKVNTGVRLEHNIQRIETALNFSPVNKGVSQLHILPAFNISYTLSSKTIFRMAWTRTLNRPEFREWAPFYYYDFDFNALNYGSLYLDPNNPLKTAEIQNLDLRFENYPGSSEMIHIAVFAKQIKNPIEATVIPTTNLAYSYYNAKSGLIYGIEAEIKKQIPIHVKIGKQDFSLGILFNGTLVKSIVDLGENRIYWDKTRNLQGQSPYIVNSGIFVESDSSKFSLALLYNIYGHRILYVGSDQFPDIVETSRHTIDLSISQKIGKFFSVSLSVQDLIPQPLILVQDFNRDQQYERDGKDPQVLNEKRGTAFEFGIKYRF